MTTAHRFHGDLQFTKRFSIIQGHNMEKNKIEKQIENLIRGVSIFSCGSQVPLLLDSFSFSSEKADRHDNQGADMSD